MCFHRQFQSESRRDDNRVAMGEASPLRGTSGLKKKHEAHLTAVAGVPSTRRCCAWWGGRPARTGFCAWLGWKYAPFLRVVGGGPFWTETLQNGIQQHWKCSSAVTV